MRRLLGSIRVFATILAVLLVPSLQLSAQGAARKPAPTPQAAAPAVETGPGGWIKEFGTMWTFEAPPLAYWKGRYGFEPSKDWLSHVQLSSVRIPGCSASFVSDKGLVMTNHHCARSCITAVSPPDTSYQEAGFVSAGEAGEKTCPGSYADQLISTEDVTAKVRAAVTARVPALQVEQRDKAIADIQTACQDGDRPGVPGGDVLSGRQVLALSVQEVHRRAPGDGTGRRDVVLRRRPRQLHLSALRPRPLAAPCLRERPADEDRALPSLEHQWRQGRRPHVRRRQSGEHRDGS